VSSTNYLSLVFVIIFLVLMILFRFLGRKKPVFPLRVISAFSKLAKTIGISVESGKRIHISLGRGSIYGEQTAVGIVGLSVLERIAQVTTISDHPPIATSGDGTFSILSQDTLKGSYRAIGAPGQYDPSSGRLTGATPFSYAVGAVPVIYDEQSSIDILLGHFGNEIALIIDASERNGNTSLAGSDNLTAQSILCATAEEPLIGEEIFAAGAYVKSGPMHVASLHAQDVMRWILVTAMIVGAILKFVGVI
jgi:hypothetical protein